MKFYSLERLINMTIHCLYYDNQWFFEVVELRRQKTEDGKSRL